LALTACVAAAPLVRGLGKVLIVVWTWLFGATGEFAAGTSLRRARSTALVVATLGTGLGAVLMFSLLAWSLENTLMAQVGARFVGDLVVTSPFIGAGYRNAPLADDLIKSLLKVDGVSAAVGLQRRTVPFRDGTILLDAYDSSCFREERPCAWPLVASIGASWVDAVVDGSGALISSRLGKQFGFRVGDEIEMPSPSGPWRVRIVGVTNTEPEAALIINRDLYRREWSDRSVTWILLLANADIAAVRARIVANLGMSQRIQVRSTQELLRFFGDQVRQAFSFSYILAAVTMGLLLIGIGDTLAASVLERVREFGLMRAIGLRRSTLFSMVFLEGAAIGINGIVLAMATGLALGLFWVYVQFPALLGWTLEPYLPYQFAAVAILLTLVLALAGSVVPSMRAAFLHVTSALRNE
jgi:putative ABC transport system permease protein